MKNLTVKKKISILLTMLIGVLACVLMAFMIFVSKTVTESTTMEQLNLTVHSNLKAIDAKDGMPDIHQDFEYQRNGVTSLVYSKSGSLLAGQLPIAFQTAVEFENGVIRKVDTGKTAYMVLDLWIPSGWEDGVWLRGLVEVPDNQAIARNMLMVFIIILPIFLLMAAFGSYHIARRAFRPLDTITAAAEAINEAKDLSGRIGLPAGKDEFSRLAADFDQMFERLERLFETEKQFTADASHELRTPVSVIKGACEYSEKYDETPEDYKESIDMIHRQSRRIAKLINELLGMTRMEQGTVPVKMEKMNLSEFVKERCRDLYNEDVDVDTETDVFIDADEALLERLLCNLVDNAMKYGKTDGYVRVEVSKTESEALLKVIDDGIGIAKEEQENIWKRFYRLDASRSQESGSGLGLSMVAQIAKMHGGYMEVESELGEGSCFILHLPL